MKQRRLSPVLLPALLITVLPSDAFGGPGSQEAAGPDTPRVESHQIVYRSENGYCAWPSIARTAAGDLIAVFTESEEHLGPDGRILLVRSTDNGRSWGPASVLYDTPIDDRESGLTAMGDGVLVAHLWSTFHTPAFYRALPEGAYEKEVLDRWIGHVGGPAYIAAGEHKGARDLISTDGGMTWEGPLPGKDAVHGGIGLQDGSVLIASYREDQPFVGIHRSAGPGTPYERIATIASPQPDSIRFGEPHIAQLPSGRIVMMLRATAIPYNDRDPRCVLWQTWSDDGGRSWTVPAPTPMWGFPAHLLVLSDGRLLCSYGYRRPPFGERACVSEDGISWDLRNEVILRSDAPNGDLGYPASVELGDGRILTIYYQPPVPPGTIQRMHPPDPLRAKPAIIGTVWQLPLLRPAPPVVIGSRRELFVDSLLIDRMEGAALRLHHPLPLGTALAFDEPWEGPFSAYATVIKDGSLYRLYYRGHAVAGDEAGTVTCYAESRDGITWKKPRLGLYPSHGRAKTNIILKGLPVFSHNFSPFLDDRPGVAAAERYKAVAGNEHTGLVGFVSSDGLRWRRMDGPPLITRGMFDSQNVAFWWAAESSYVCYLRTWTGEGYSGYRTISRSVSTDFRSWSEPVAMTFGDTPLEQLYTNGTTPYFRAPHIAIALAKRFFPDRPAIAAPEARALVVDSAYASSSSDAVLMSTRGGTRYDRTFMEAFIRPGDSAEDWVSRDNTPAAGIVPGPGRTMLLYRGSHYAQRSAHLRVYGLRADGFASLHATAGGGVLVTKPLVFTGDALNVNLSTSAAGELRVEFLNALGQAIPGFSAEDAVPLRGDGTAMRVSWRGGASVGTLAGAPVRIRFILRDGDLFSFRFVSREMPEERER